MTAPKQSFPELYDIYCAMKDRCYRERSQFYHLYGKLGVKVCDRWLDKVHGFENFVLDVGPRPPGKDYRGRALYSIDRYPDSSGDYRPGNVRWATNSEQMSNRRRSKTDGFPGYQASMLASLAVANVKSVSVNYPAR